MSIRFKVAPAAIALVFQGAYAIPAHADDWGCEVLLCLANPAGPMAVSQCVPPISRLWRAMASWSFSFPSCALASGPAGNSWAQRESNYYDPCPNGTTALPQGSAAVQASSMSNVPLTPTYWLGMGDGAGMVPNWESAMPAKVCVGPQIGSTYVSVNSGESLDSMPAGVYQNVTILNAGNTPNLINVFINNTLYRTVRY